MKTEYRPNAYYMRGALPTVEQSRDEYIGSVYGAAALDYITIIHANEAIDMLHERCPGEAERPEVRKRIRAMTGTKGRIGAMRLLELAISDQLTDKQGKAWMADFGNIAYYKVLPQIEALQTAVANALGRYKGVPDINACAAVIVAQSLAHEAVEYVKRRAAKFTNFTITTHDGRRMSVSSSLASMSPAGLDFCLKNIARMLIEKHLPHDVDLAADPSVMTGLKAVLNTMADPKTWAYARDKADSLNTKKNNEMQKRMSNERDTEEKD